MKARRSRLPHHQVAILGFTLSLLMIVVVGLGVLSLTSVNAKFETFAEEDFPGFNQLLHIDRDLYRSQRSIEGAFHTDSLDDRFVAVRDFEEIVDSIEARWESYLLVAHNSPEEIELQGAFVEHRSTWLAVAGELKQLAIAGNDATDPQVSATLIESKHHFELTRTASHVLEEKFYEPLVERGTEAGQFDARLLLSALLAAGLFVGGVATVSSVGTTRNQYDELRRRQLNKRFQSLVESVDDVITVVSDRDTVSVMTTNTTACTVFGPGQDVRHVRDCLDDHQFDRWLAADTRVLHDQKSCAIEFQRIDAGGSEQYFEAHGTPMASEPTERVWVWRDVTERKALELRLAHDAFHDPLTGLPNRALLVDRAQHALTVSARSSAPVSILFCDLDHFKAVNDSLGHTRGDELLCIVAQRLSECVRDSDTLARFGGDEFAILLDSADADAAQKLGERILEVIPQQVTLGENLVFPSISIGSATSGPGSTAEELLRKSDLAMYEAKRAGKGRVELFQDGMERMAHDALGLHSDLTTAIRREEFELYYQPTYQLSDGALSGVEALIRWPHPERGLISPSDFIPVAEATGAIVSLGSWALFEACGAAVELQTHTAAATPMHVNLSPQQLRDPAVVDLVRSGLETSGLTPDLLVLEVTEGFLLDDDASVSRLHQLHQLGVRIAIDDFGTGYTSISYLQQLPIDIIKIDRSFVSGDVLAESKRRGFLDAILGLATSLELTCVAEGIEKRWQHDELLELGCDAGQGYFWSAAVPFADLIALVKPDDARDLTDRAA